jgi:hypothetical protein
MGYSESYTSDGGAGYVRSSRTLGPSIDRLLALVITFPAEPIGAELALHRILLIRAEPGWPRHSGGRMPTVFVYHDVKDKDHWLASPKREEFLGPLGVTNIRLFVDPENPTRVGGLMDVSDMGAVMDAMKTEAAAEAMASDGVVPETLVILVEA